MTLLFCLIDNERDKAIKGEKMENINWSKTLLGVYRYLPRVANAYDKIVKTRAYNSHYHTYNSAFNDVMNVANFILDMSEKKVTLINTKLITEKALSCMNTQLAQILIYKFIDGKKCVEIADKLNVCLRTFFRKLNSALVSFYRTLERMGYNENKLCEMLKNEKWIMNIYNNYSTAQDDSLQNIVEGYEIKQQIKASILFDFKQASVI